MRLAVPTLTPRRRATQRSAPPSRSVARVGRWLFGEVRIPRQTLFGRQRVHALKEALQTLEISVAFSCNERFAMVRACFAPSLRDQRRIRGYVLDRQHDKAGLTQHAFVHAGWHEHIEADRASDGDLLI